MPQMRPKKKNKMEVKIKYIGVPIVPQQVKNPTGIHEDEGSIPGLSKVKDPALPQAVALVLRCGLNPVLLWL